MSKHQQQKKHQTHKVSWRESDHIDSWKTVSKEWKRKTRKNVQTQIQLRFIVPSQCTSLYTLMRLPKMMTFSCTSWASRQKGSSLSLGPSLIHSKVFPRKIVAFISRSWCLALGCFVMEKNGQSCGCDFSFIFEATRWAPTWKKWTYNPTSRDISPFITGWGPPCISYVKKTQPLTSKINPINPQIVHEFLLGIYRGSDFFPMTTSSNCLRLSPVGGLQTIQFIEASARPKSRTFETWKPQGA